MTTASLDRECDRVRAVFESQDGTRAEPHFFFIDDYAKRIADGTMLKYWKVRGWPKVRNVLGPGFCETGRTVQHVVNLHEGEYVPAGDEIEVERGALVADLIQWHLMQD